MLGIGTRNAGYTVFAILPANAEGRVVVAARDGDRSVTWEATPDGKEFYWGHYFLNARQNDVLKDLIARSSI